jgi:uncharacterized membrane-anchored protein
MSGHGLQSVIEAAQAEGLLPAGAQPASGGSDRPWPVVALTGLGAWLAAIPLLGVLALILGKLFEHGAGVFIAGLLLLGASVAVLRGRSMPLFLEQFAVPGLLAGAAGLAVGLYRDLPVALASITLAAMMVVVALIVAQPWLRALLGVAGAGLFALAFLPAHASVPNESGFVLFWMAWHLNLVLWLLAGGWQRVLLNDSAGVTTAAALESLRTGWLLATLCGLAWWAGMTFLVAGSTGRGFLYEIARDLALRPSTDVQALMLRPASVLLGLAGALWADSQWPAFRRPWYGLVAAVLVALAWFMPTLGGVLLVLAVCVTSSRRRLAITALAAALWIVGAFYYQLGWTLTAKAAALLGAGALLAVCAWLAWRAAGGTVPAFSRPATAAPSRSARLAIGASALAVLAAINAGAWQKEDLIAHGQPVFVEMAPVDPRSLAQGDYMRLNFRVPFDVQVKTGGVLSAARPRVVGRRDERGVATLLRLDDGAPLAPDEFRMELTSRDGRWTLVSDAWYFKEGEAARWAGAKFGEFRVDPDGQALLVGLRGGDLQPL